MIEMENSPIAKNHAFLKELGIDIDKVEDQSERLTFSYLVNQIDGISKMKHAIEAMVLPDEVISEAGGSVEDVEKFQLYRLWLLCQLGIEMSEFAQSYNVDYEIDDQCHEIINDPHAAEATALFQSEKWQKKLWGQWATPPYSDKPEFIRLPNPENTIVDIKKIRDYCLNKEHQKGRHKARVFEAALGLTIEHAEQLREALMEVPLRGAALPTELTEYGQLYIIDFTMTVNSETEAQIRSSWIVRNGENFPRLTSCYVL
jgi:hypothetical protein